MGDALLGEANEAKRGPVEDRRAPRATREREPHFEGRLRRQLVQLKRREQAHNTPRHAARGMDERSMFGGLRVGSRVESSSNSAKHATFAEPREGHARDPVLLEVPWAKHAVRLRDSE